MTYYLLMKDDTEKDTINSTNTLGEISFNTLPYNYDTDCSLNGICNKQTGNCTCNTGWNGYKCHFISFYTIKTN